MMALAKSGDVKVQKLLEFREWIVEESKKAENRYFRKDGRKGRLNIEFRHLILLKLLALQSEINLELISKLELQSIERLFQSGGYRNY